MSEHVMNNDQEKESCIIDEIINCEKYSRIWWALMRAYRKYAFLKNDPDLTDRWLVHDFTIKCFIEGDTIETRKSKTIDWTLTTHPHFDINTQYRVKVEYIPFSTVKQTIPFQGCTVQKKDDPVNLYIFSGAYKDERDILMCVLKNGTRKFVISAVEAYHKCRAYWHPFGREL